MANSPTVTSDSQVLSEFRAWVLGLSEDRLALMGIDASVEEPLRLLRGFAAEKGYAL